MGRKQAEGHQSQELTERHEREGQQICKVQTPASHSCSESVRAWGSGHCSPDPLPAFQGALRLDWQSFPPHPLPHPALWWA